MAAFHSLNAPARERKMATSPDLHAFHRDATTLMSVFSSSRRTNLWLQWKQLVQALPGKAGGTVVMTTVDHPLMRGSKPHDR
jgi:hypothetical protein